MQTPVFLAGVKLEKKFLLEKVINSCILKDSVLFYIYIYTYILLNVIIFSYFEGLFVWKQYALTL